MNNGCDHNDHVSRVTDHNGRAYALECRCGLSRWPLDDSGRKAPKVQPARIETRGKDCGICGAASPGALLCTACYRPPCPMAMPCLDGLPTCPTCRARVN